MVPFGNAEGVPAGGGRADVHQHRLGSSGLQLDTALRHFAESKVSQPATRRHAKDVGQIEQIIIAQAHDRSLYRRDLVHSAIV